MQKKYAKGLSAKFFRIVNFYKNFENMPLNRVFFFIRLFPKVILKLQKSIIREDKNGIFNNPYIIKKMFP